jgi:hypothetical protein
MAKRTDPFDVKLSDDDKATLTRRLCDAVRVGLTARDSIIQDGGWIDFWYSLYEQQPQRSGPSRQEQASADLTSPIGTQMVDTLTAIAGKTINVEPIYVVEGIGADQAKAPAVEEFMQWRLEEMRAQGELIVAIQQAFIEEGAILEACEDALEVRRTKTVKAQIQKAEDGAMLLDIKGNPVPVMGDDGEPVPAEDTAEEFTECVHKYTDTVRRGASLRRHSLKDFLFLPGHAKSQREAWGQAVRFWMPLDELRQAEEYGTYSDVDRLGTSNERETREEHNRAGVSVEVDSASDKVEKELWRIQFYANLDGKGICFYIATISLEHECILRLKMDWIGRFRSVYLNPYPRPTGIYGYSLIGHKLLTTIEGHTAWRNMNADRGMLAANKPMKRLHGSMWEPDIQPIGAGQVIDVGDMRELEELQIADVTAQAFQREREFYEEAARIVGVSDILASVNPKVQRTLGENEMVTEQSFTRAENPIRNIQEGALEDLFEIIHAIEVKALEDAETGVEPPAGIAQNVQLRMQPDNQEPGDDAAFAFTADMLRGRFRGKPRGSSETADPNRRVNTWVNSLEIADRAAKANPYFANQLASPDVGKALMQQYVDLTKPRDKAAFLTPAPPPMPPPGMAPPGMHPGMPPGAPPMGGPMPGPPSFGGEQLVQQMAANLPPAGGVQ